MKVQKHTIAGSLSLQKVNFKIQVKSYDMLQIFELKSLVQNNDFFIVIEVPPLPV